MPFLNRFREIEFEAPRSKGKFAGLSLRASLLSRAASLALSLAACLTLTLSGCSKIDTPLYKYGPEGERILFKRVPKNMEVNFFTRSDRKAYERGSTFTADHLSDEQRETYEAYGHPEYVRRPFDSRVDEKVDEWVYQRHNYLVQWIDGHKTFEGDVTDIERTLLVRGYPATTFYSMDEHGIEIQHWIYQREDIVEAAVISFTDGRLAYTNTNH